MKKKKIFLTPEDLELGPSVLMKKYNMSSRGHAHYVLGKGYFWENYLSIYENFDQQWVGQNFKEIEALALKWVSILGWKRGGTYHRLFSFFKEDILQDGIMYVMQKSGDIKNDSFSLNTTMKIGISNSMRKYLSHGEGKFLMSSSEFYFLVEKFADEMADEEDNSDLIFDQIREEVCATLGKKAWSQVWLWASSDQYKCPEAVLSLIKQFVL